MGRKLDIFSGDFTLGINTIVVWLILGTMKLELR